MAKPRAADHGAAFIGSLTIFSYDYKSQTIDLVCLRTTSAAPEIERFLARRASKGGPIKIDTVTSTAASTSCAARWRTRPGCHRFRAGVQRGRHRGATDHVFGGLDVDVRWHSRSTPSTSRGASIRQGRSSKDHRSSAACSDPVHQDGPVRSTTTLGSSTTRASTGVSGLDGRAREERRRRCFLAGRRSSSAAKCFLAIAYDFDLRGLLVENIGT